MNGHWVYWFFEETYRENVYLIWPVNEQQRRAFILKHFDLAPDEASDRWNARASAVENNDGRTGQIIALRTWRNEAADAGMLAHESLHVTHNILSKRAVLFDNDPEACNEAYTYMLARIVRTCSEALSMVNLKRAGLS